MKVKSRYAGLLTKTGSTLAMLALSFIGLFGTLEPNQDGFAGSFIGEVHAQLSNCIYLDPDRDLDRDRERARNIPS